MSIKAKSPEDLLYENTIANSKCVGKEADRISRELKQAIKVNDRERADALILELQKNEEELAEVIDKLTALLPSKKP